MRLSEKLKQAHECGDFGKALEGYPERAEFLEVALEQAIEELEVYQAGGQINVHQFPAWLNLLKDALEGNIVKSDEV